MNPQIWLAIISILREVLKLLGEKNREYKTNMTKAERKEMLKRDALKIKQAFKDKDEKALNAVFSNHLD